MSSEGSNHYTDSAALVSTLATQEDRIQNLQDQVASLQERVNHLGNQRNNFKDLSKYPLSGTLKASEAPAI